MGESFGSKGTSDGTVDRRRSRASRPSSTEDERAKLRKQILKNRPVFGPEALRNLKDYLIHLDKHEINQRDIFGRTLLHIAASVGNTVLIESLLENRHIDISICDYENNWNALHRALAYGNIAAAELLLNRSGNCIKDKDRVKDTPFDLANPSMDNMRGTKFDLKVGGSELFMFGSNFNHTLGFADLDNRARPEMVRLEKAALYPDEADELPPSKFVPPRIRDIQISKLHSALLIGSRSHNNLLMCGITRGGRLGLGKGSKPTQFTFTPVSGLQSHKIISVALGLDHSVAITSEGDCYTWGGNKYGQLGYQIEPNFQDTPRKVVGELRRRGLKLKGCAASNISTVVHTSHEIYSWGTNAGQMGFKPTSSKGLTEDIEYLPRHTSHMRHRIIKVCCCDLATLVLDKNSYIHVFMNYGNFRVHLPTFEHNESFDLFTPRQGIEKVVDIRCSGNGWVAARTNRGTVYRFSLKKYHDSDAKVSMIAKQLRPTVVWKPKRDGLRANDVDIADNGSTIISCAAGVWKSRGKGGGAYFSKFERVPLVNRIVQVRCDSLFESFAAIRNDLVSQPIRVDNEILSQDTHYLVPFIECIEDRKKSDSLVVHYPPAEHISRFGKGSKIQDEDDLSIRAERPPPLHFSSRASENSDSDFEVSEEDDEEDLSDDNGGDDGFKMSEKGSHELEHLTNWVVRCSEDELKDIFLSFNGDTKEYDFKIKVIVEKQELFINVHSSVMQARCRRLNIKESESFSSITASGCQMSFNKDENFLVLEGFELLTVILFIYDLYTGHVMPIWSSLQRTPKNFFKVKEELLDIGRLLQFDHLCLSTLQTKIVDSTLGYNMVSLRNNAVARPDVQFVLADGAQYLAHSFVLKCRSAYFDVLLSTRWERSSSETESGLIVINFDTVAYEVLDVIMLHLYGDYQDNLFCDVTSENQRAFVTLVLSVMELADTLLLEKLVQLCEAAVLCFINVKNAGWLLDVIIRYSAPQLEDRLLKYICHNITSILENQFLSGVSVDSLKRLDNAMRDLISANGNFKGCIDESSFYEFINDFDGHNEKFSRISPIYGSNSTVSFLPVKSKAVFKDLEDGIFSLDLDAAESDTPSRSVMQERRIPKISPRRDSSYERQSISPATRDEWVTVGDSKKSSIAGSPAITKSILGTSSPVNIAARVGTERRVLNTPVNFNDSMSNSWNSPSGSLGSAVRGSHAQTPKRKISNCGTATTSSAEKGRDDNAIVKPISISLFSTNGESSQKEKKTVLPERFPETPSSLWRNASSPSPQISNQGSLVVSPNASGSKSSLSRMIGQKNVLGSDEHTNTSLSARSSTKEKTSSWKGKEKENGFTPSPKFGKASQKERRKMAQASEELKSDKARRNSSSNPWGVTNAVEVYEPLFDSPVVGTGSSRNKAKDKAKVQEDAMELVSELVPSLADIMKQDMVRKEKREEAVKTLEEIQEEERFQKWWEEESRRVQSLNASNNQPANESTKKSSDKRKKNNNRGRGNKGR